MGSEPGCRGSHSRILSGTQIAGGEGRCWEDLMRNSSKGFIAGGGHQNSPVTLKVTGQPRKCSEAPLGTFQMACLVLGPPFKSTEKGARAMV